MKPTLAPVPAEESAPALDVPALAALLRGRLADASRVFRGVGALSFLRCLVWALLSPRPQNVIALGPPGVAKTMVAGTLARWTGDVFLDVQFSPWTDVADLLGPVDLAALQAGRMERAPGTSTRPTLSNAGIVNMDEVPRGGPGIRAAALRPMAERRMPTGEPIPAWVIIATANTRLTSEEDRAMVDRFALRVEVPRLMDPADLGAVMFREVPRGGRRQVLPTLDPLPAGLVETLRAHADTVDFPEDVAAALERLAITLRQPSPTGATYPDVSERRWVLITRLLQAHAALRGDSVVSWQDLSEVLPYCLDDGAESRPALTAAITASMPGYVRALADLEAVCVAAVERARRVGAANAPGADPMRPGDGDAHAQLDAELDAIVAPLAQHGRDVHQRAQERADRCRDEAADAYAEGLAIAKAARARK